MCRLTAVITSGEPLLLADILTRPRMSIIHQSFNCKERLANTDIRKAYQKSSLNGDGFGVAWYCNNKTQSSALEDRDLSALIRDINGVSRKASTAAVRHTKYDPNDVEPCLFTSLKPAWADRNLYNIADKVSSRLFFAHVRAASSNLSLSSGACSGGCRPSDRLPFWATAGASVSTELCCHPFRCGRFLFMHNGCIGGFASIRRELLSLLPDTLFSYAITNSCIDSVCLFALFLAMLPSDPFSPTTPSIIKEAVEKMISTTCWLLSKLKDDCENTLINIVVTDGTCVVATRFATNLQELTKCSVDGEEIEGDWNSVSCPSASLYFATGTWWQQDGDKPESYRMTHADKRTDICIVTSEPLTPDSESWMPVPPNSLLLITPAIDLLIYPITCSATLQLDQKQVELTTPISRSISSPALEPHIYIEDQIGNLLANEWGDRFIHNYLSLVLVPRKLSNFDIQRLCTSSLRELYHFFLSIVQDGKSQSTKPISNGLFEFRQRIDALDNEETWKESIREIGPDECTPRASFDENEIHNEPTSLPWVLAYQVSTGMSAIVSVEHMRIGGVRSPEHYDTFGEYFVFVGRQDGVVSVLECSFAPRLICSFKAHSGGVLALSAFAKLPGANEKRRKPCSSCGLVVPEFFLITGGSDTCLAVWNLTDVICGVLFGTVNKDSYTGNGVDSFIPSESLLSLHISLVPHQGDILALLVSFCSPQVDKNCYIDQSGRFCWMQTCTDCFPVNDAIPVAGDLYSGSSDFAENGGDGINSPTATVRSALGDFTYLYVGFQSTKVGLIDVQQIIMYISMVESILSVVHGAFVHDERLPIVLESKKDCDIKRQIGSNDFSSFKTQKEAEAFSATYKAMRYVKIVARIWDERKNGFFRGGTTKHLHARPRCVLPPPNAVYVSQRPEELQLPILSDINTQKSSKGFRLVPKSSIVSIEAVSAPRTISDIKIEMKFLPIDKGSRPPGSTPMSTPVPSRTASQSVESKANVPFESPQSFRTNGVCGRMGGHNGFVECMLSCGSDLICSGGGDGRIVLWSARGQFLGEFTGHYGGVLCLAFSEGQTRGPLSVGCLNSAEYNRNKNGSQEIRKRQSKEKVLQQRLLFSGSRDKSIKVWLIDQGVCLNTLNRHAADVLSLAVLPERCILASGAANGELFIWRYDTMTIVCSVGSLPYACSGEQMYLHAVNQRSPLRTCKMDKEPIQAAVTGLILESNAMKADDCFLFNGYSDSFRALDEEFKDIKRRRRKICSCNVEGVASGVLRLWASGGDGKVNVWDLTALITSEIWDNARSSLTFISDFNDADDDVVFDSKCIPILERWQDIDSQKINHSVDSYSKHQELCGTIPIGEQDELKTKRINEDSDSTSSMAILSKKLGQNISLISAVPLYPGVGNAGFSASFFSLLAKYISLPSVSGSSYPPYICGGVAAATFTEHLLESIVGATTDVVWHGEGGACVERKVDRNQNAEGVDIFPTVFGQLKSDNQKPTIVFYSHYDVVCVGGSAKGPHSCSVDMKYRRDDLAGEKLDTSSVQPIGASACILPNANGEENKGLPPGWKTDPWKLRLKDAYAYGRGVSDNKGPILCTLFAVKRFLDWWTEKHENQVTENTTDIPANSRTRNVHRPRALSPGNIFLCEDVSSCLGKVPSLPFNFLWICEGEDENGSRGLKQALEKKEDWLRGAQYFVSTSSYWVDDSNPCIVYGMRGVLDLEVKVSNGVKVKGVHSGVHGGAVVEPMQDLIDLLSRLKNGNGKEITIPGFYDNVQKPSADEVERIQKCAGVLHSEEFHGLGSRQKDIEQILSSRWIEPAVSVLDVSSSSTGMHCENVAASRIIPSYACAAISFRLVNNQKSQEIFAVVKDFLTKTHEESGSTNLLEVKLIRGGEAWEANLQDEKTLSLCDSVAQATKDEWKTDALYVREGGSMPAIPIVMDAAGLVYNHPHFVVTLWYVKEKCSGRKVAVCQLPIGQAGDNAHLPNERISVSNLEKGIAILFKTFKKLATVVEKK